MPGSAQENGGRTPAGPRDPHGSAPSRSLTSPACRQAPVFSAGGQGGDIHRTGGSLLITRLSGDRPMVVHVLPLCEERTVRDEASVLVLMIDPDLPADPGPALLREFFGLSAAEAAVASRIVRGDNLKSIACDLSVSLTTVRTQLQNVFEKTDTHRQADLVRLLLRTGVI